VFTTPLGKLTAPKLREACTVEKSKRSTTLTPLGWRVRVEELRDRVVQAQTELEHAKGAADPKARLSALAVAAGGFTECVERAEALAGDTAADKNAKVKLGKADLTLQGVRKLCEGAGAEVRKETDKATADQELTSFMASLRSDELEVARREGRPSRVENRGGGRVFIYDAKGKAKAKRFAFNAEGHRVDEKSLGASAPTLEAIPPK